MRSVVPSRPVPLPLAYHYSCLNLFRDSSTKRHMEHICGRHPHPPDPPPPPSNTFPQFALASSSYPPSGIPCYRSINPKPGPSFPPHVRLELSCVSEKDEERFYPKDSNCEGSSIAGEEVNSETNEEEQVCEVGPPKEHPQPLSHCDARSPPESRPHSGDTRLLAAIDMGSNSFHMVVVKADCHGGFQVLDSEKEHIRLGSGAGMCLITPEAEAWALEAMKRFKALAKAYKAPLRIVATAAVREAGNRGAFLRKICDEAGVEIEVLSGHDEARLIYLGVLQALPIYNKLVLVIDIGGGSTEFVLGKGGAPIFATSVKVGHLFLTERFIGSGSAPLQKGQVEDLRKHIRGALRDAGVVDQVRCAGFELAIGSSGTIETIENLVSQGYACDYGTSLLTEQSHIGLHGFRDREFTRDELAVMVRKLCQAKNNEHRAKSFGISGKRAEFLVAGAVLLEETFFALDIHSLKVSPYALREGVIADTLTKRCSNFKTSANLRRSSVVSFAKRFYTQERMTSASHCACLAKDILVGLKATGLGTGCISEVASLLDSDGKELLEAAATLHAVGISISYKDYHKHSQYLIKCLAEQRHPCWLQPC